MARTSITIVLELEETVGSPAGSAHLPDGTCRTFHGWLGLAETIDSLAGMYAKSAARSSASRRAKPDPTNVNPVE